MTLTDTCKCGVTFEARGMPANVQAHYVLWLNAHRHCRADSNVIELVDSCDE